MAFTRIDYEAVRSLFGTGLSDRAIARQTRVSQGTVRRWRLTPSPPSTVLRSDLAERSTIDDAAAYCYLLGAYLGDGTVGHRPPDYRDLRIVNDRRYQRISAEILGAMRSTFLAAQPGCALHGWASRTSCPSHIPQSGAPVRSTDPGASTFARSR